MTKPQKPCSRCKGEMTPVKLPPFEGAEGEVKLTVIGMPAVACAEDHKRFVYPEFAALLMDFTAETAHYELAEPAVKRGLLRKHYHCPACGRELSPAPAATRRVEFDVDLHDAEPFRLAVEVPIYNCPSCGAECEHPPEELAQLGFKAVAHAYRSVDIHPE